MSRSVRVSVVPKLHSSVRVVWVDDFLLICLPGPSDFRRRVEKPKGRLTILTLDDIGMVVVASLSSVARIGNDEGAVMGVGSRERPLCLLRCRCVCLCLQIFFYIFSRPFTANSERMVCPTYKGTNSKVV